jgi:hypothetical protein
MATKYSFNAHTIAESNKAKAEVELEAKWTALSTSDKDTWLANSHFNTPTKIKDPDGKKEFLHYYMQHFGGTTNSNTTAFATTTLGAGTGSDYTSRASRTWTTT